MLSGGKNKICYRWEETISTNGSSHPNNQPYRIVIPEERNDQLFGVDKYQVRVGHYNISKKTKIRDIKDGN